MFSATQLIVNSRISQYASVDAELLPDAGMVLGKLPNRPSVATKRDGDVASTAGYVVER